MKRIWLGVIAFLLIALLLGVLVLKYKYHVEYTSVSVQKTVVEKTYENYGEQAIKAGKRYDLPPEYLLSLIVLESSGRKIIPQRYESHVFRKLDNVARGKANNLEGIKADQLSGMSDGELKQLASSWGPFQIMGYKCFEIDVEVHDLQGKNAVSNGAKWIDKKTLRMLSTFTIRVNRIRHLVRPRHITKIMYPRASNMPANLRV
ncbi:MAG: hypothetical protein JJ975_16880 [Bacteroidia bacterium]|nr:hypothetical protein [Bacteroidia bacterium]